MDDFQLIDAPVKKPWCCVVCGSQKGPVLDTFCNRWGENLYLCRYCTETAARGWGLVEGALNSDMLNAQEILLEREKEIAALKKTRERLKETIKDRDFSLSALAEERNAAVDRVTQFEHLIGEAARTLNDATAAAV